MLENTAQRLAESPRAEPRASKPTGGEYGRVPNAIALSFDLSCEATFIIADRSRHGNKGTMGWGCNHRAMAKKVSAGLSLGLFKRGVRDAKAAGHLERTQGRRKSGRGRGYAVDRLTFEPPTTNYVKVGRALFDGTLTPTEITAIVYLSARGDCCAAPWQLMRRLGVTRSTLSSIMRGFKKKGEHQPGLVERGYVKNFGTLAAPLWGLATLQNPTLKRPILKTTALKRTTHTRKTSPARQISPARHESKEHEGPATEKNGSGGRENVAAATFSFENARKRTDLVSGTAAVLAAATSPPESARGSAMAALGDRLPFADSVLHEIHLLGVNVEALIDKLFEYEGKNAAKGKPIADRNAYLLQMARDEIAKANGVSVDALKGIASPNEWVRGAAYAKAMGTPPMLAKGPPPALPEEGQRNRIARDLVRAGLVPAEVEQRWLKGRSDGTIRSDYLQYATAMRGNAKRPQAQRRAVA